jgi:Protein of unknown function VcgC/VcgE (DUF2780)
MRTTGHRSLLSTVAVLGSLLGSFSIPEPALSAPPAHAIGAQLQEQFGLNEQQVRGALGTLLVFAREKMSKPDFDDFARRIPNAEYIMQEIKQRGIVTKPLDDVDEYEASLANLGIGQPMASQFAPAVLDYLQAAGFTRERDTLARILR